MNCAPFVVGIEQLSITREPSNALDEVEKYYYTKSGNKIIKQEMTEVQYYRSQLEQIQGELYNLVINFLQVNEGEKFENEWTNEEYQNILEKYKEKVNQVNKIFENYNK